eukprot:scaffold2643_cov117-Isochrysis_galbana.AAC.6
MASGQRREGPITGFSFGRLLPERLYNSDDRRSIGVWAPGYYIPSESLWEYEEGRDILRGYARTAKGKNMSSYLPAE